jgi:hypothetical protein
MGLLNLMRRSTTRSLILLTLIIPMLLGLGCCNEAPYFTAMEIDEGTPQAKALIRLSHPQVFTREALITDRYRERDHLIAGLGRADWNLAFTPQLRRDLSQISALSGQLGLSFDPAAAVGFAGQRAAFEQGAERNALASEIETVRLQAELLRVQRDLEALRAGTGTGPTGPTTAPAAAQAPGSLPVPPLPSTTRAIEDLAKVLTDVIAKIEAPARASGLTTSPEEQYTDLAAYRARLRSDLSATQLDDVHDLDGNALYRFQFRAHLMPPSEPRNRWGLAQLVPGPPLLGDDDVRILYFTWLAHVTARLNLLNRAGTIDTNDTYLRLGRATYLYRVAEIPVGKPGVLRIAVMARESETLRTEELIERFLGDPRKLPDLKAARKRAELHLGISGAPRLVVSRRETGWRGSECGATALPAAVSNGTQMVDDYELAEATIQATLSIEAAIAGLERGSLRRTARGEALLADLRARAARFDAIFRDAAALLNAWRTPDTDDFEECLSVADTIRRRARHMPDKFCEAIIADWDETWKGPDACGLDVDAKAKARGDAYAYAAQPELQEQRLSTLASAANSLNLALAVAAADPQSGLGGQAAANHMRAAVGKVDAIERTPLVVGFASGHGQADATFGWVFGPKVFVDAQEETLELRQTLAARQVFADLSLPAWWPAVELSVTSAWVHNWYAGEDYLEKENWSETTTTKPMRVDLPMARGDLDAFTDHLRQFALRQALGLNSAHIYSVSPAKVKGCKEGVTFLIEGPDLWRDPTVYLRGQKHESVSVLPDMAGIAATFKLETLPRFPQGAGDELTVVTQRGSDSSPIELTLTCKVALPAGTKVTLSDGTTGVAD